MINEVFGNYVVTYSLRGYWETFTPLIVEVWPRSGPTSVDIDIKSKFINHIKSKVEDKKQ